MTNWRPQALRSDAGYTLLETLAVLGIVALATSIVMPNILASRQNLQLRATAIELTSNLKLTRSAASASNADKILIIDTVRRNYASLGTVKMHPIPRDIALTFEAQAAETLVPSRGGFRFRPDGTASGGAIKLSSGADTATISVDWLTGAVILRWR
jgi:general secretion pathway protein H